MSQIMFERIAEMNVLREFNRAVARMNDEDKKNLELEYERLTNLECDEAARMQSDEQFAASMRHAYEIMMKKKQRSTSNDEKVPEIYA